MGAIIPNKTSKAIPKSLCFLIPVSEAIESSLSLNRILQR
jgi:hypothetical protein